MNAPEALNTNSFKPQPVRRSFQDISYEEAVDRAQKMVPFLQNL